jgi:hypothetical protein
MKNSSLFVAVEAATGLFNCGIPMREDAQSEA